ncbi:uncharacterized protein LOC124306344 isoform X1 [Neodiprion virginianus]|uniref:uncharacterized protein LOC124306344 isoform X1 n=1 Tax=Neodiprion virginianus TaxID=2961670 RepID=UPI001EE6FEB4|nr:uncharacterized protein LOC124306344 isoform X1 [Neodiprion virginianus]
MVPAFGLFVLLLPPLIVGAGDFDLHRGIGSTDHWLHASNDSATRSGLIISRFLPDGEFERVSTWPGFCAKETSIDWGDIDVTLREVWIKNEGRKLQLIYEGGILSDCFDVEADQDADDDRECSGSSRPEIEDEDEDEEEKGDEAVFQVTEKNIADWFVSAEDLRRQCFRVRTRTRNQVMARHGQSIRVRRGMFQALMMAPGTKWCGPTQLASRYNELGAFDQLDRCCRRHDHCHRAIPPMTQRYDYYNSMPFTLSHCGCDQRRYDDGDESNRRRRRRRGRHRGKRDLLIIPGTQWCGRGHRATKYTNLGGFGSADACCRRHDTTCPFFIPAFQTKYDLFNWGISTLMHCACDERFRTCLKMAGTSSANFVGKLFFNVVQTKCFVLKPQKACQRRSWWGKCEAYEYRKQAHLRDNVPY